MPEIDNIELRSEEVQEIIGHTPAWLIRGGITVIFLIIASILIGSFFFKYPDIISARITLTGDNPPADIRARSNGKITNLFVTDKQKVTEGETLAEIENTCKYENYKIFKIQLDSLNLIISKPDGSLINYTPKQNLQLGELQQHYSQFIRQLSSYKDFISLNYHNKKIEAINEQIAGYRKYSANLRRQLSLAKHDLKLAKKQYERDSALLSVKAEAEVVVEQSESFYLQKRNSFENAKNSISNTDISVAGLQQSILDLQLQYLEQKQNAEISLKETFENLKAQAKLWEQSYLLKSPINGEITFTGFWNINQNVTTGESVFTVVPKASTELIGRAEIPAVGSGKVKEGQRVNIRFDDYPDTQFGMVRGEISAISLVRSNEFYIVKVTFPDSLTTNYKEKLPFKQNMQGNADIITEDLPLIVRFVNPIKSLFYENM